MSLSFSWQKAAYQFSEERVQREPQSHGAPLPSGDGLHAVGVLPSGGETHHPATLGFYGRLDTVDQEQMWSPIDGYLFHLLTDLDSPSLFWRPFLWIWTPRPQNLRWDITVRWRWTGSTVGLRTQKRQLWSSPDKTPRPTCSLCTCTPAAPSSIRWPRGRAGSCQRG